jgi:replicative superfamily II helicase
VDAIYAEKRYWPEPLIQINPSYKRTTTVAELSQLGRLDPAARQSSRADGAPRARSTSTRRRPSRWPRTGESYVVTTGTGSGKSLCFFIPIVSAVLAEKRLGAARRTRAIVIYPMNALANSQFEELAKYLPTARADAR